MADPAKAQAFLAATENLADLEPWDIVQRFCLPWREAEKLLFGERLKRGDITIADLTQPQRRMLVDPVNLDLHAIAAGPIMDSNALYLPAGRISLEEARAREAAQVEVLRNG